MIFQNVQFVVYLSVDGAPTVGICASWMLYVWINLTTQHVCVRLAHVQHSRWHCQVKALTTILEDSVWTAAGCFEAGDNVVFLLVPCSVMMKVRHNTAVPLGLFFLAIMLHRGMNTTVQSTKHYIDNLDTGSLEWDFDVLMTTIWRPNIDGRGNRP